MRKEGRDGRQEMGLHVTKHAPSESPAHGLLMSLIFFPRGKVIIQCPGPQQFRSGCTPPPPPSAPQDLETTQNNCAALTAAEEESPGGPGQLTAV